MVQTTQSGHSDSRSSKPRRSRRTTATRTARGRKRSSQRGKSFDVEQVFLRELKNASDAEDQFGRLLSNISQAVSGRDFRNLVAFLESRTQSAQRSLERVLQEHDRSGRAGSVACKPMRAMAQEATRGRRTADDSFETELLTITNLQKMLHYLIASLGSLRAWSEMVEDRDAGILFRNLTDELKAADRELSQFSENELWSRGSGGDGDGDSWSRGSRRTVRS